MDEEGKHSERSARVHWVLTCVFYQVDIFSKDIILIPVNHQNQHWTAAAINFKQKRIESYDSLHMAGKSVCDVSSRVRYRGPGEQQLRLHARFSGTTWTLNTATRKRSPSTLVVGSIWLPRSVHLPLLVRNKPNFAILG